MQDDSETIDLSVIIPVRNNRPELAVQLESLAAQEFNGRWEVLISDNGSTDGSSEVAASFQGRLPSVTLIDASEYAGQAFALNAAVSEARGRSCLFLDADDRVASGYLNAMSESLRSHPFVAARLDCDALNEPDLRASRPPTQIDGIGAPFGYLPSAAGCSLGIWRETFDAVGGFDPSIQAGNDVDFCWRVQRLTAPLVFVPEAVVEYRYRQTLKGIFDQARAYGVAGPALYSRYAKVGMPRRSWKGALRFHAAGVARIFLVRSRADLNAVTFLLGFRLGILEGCIRYRVRYL